MNENVVLALAAVCGIALVVLGLTRRGGRTVSADHGSAAVGGNNTSPINVSTQGSPASHKSGPHVLTVIGIVVEVVVIIVGVIELLHRNAK